ncbi:MAG: TolC family protein [Phocaeicola sp.]
MKPLFGITLLLFLSAPAKAQSPLTLDSCRSLALSHNKELLIAKEQISVAHYKQKAAYTNFLPKVEGMGSYMRTQKEISLLSEHQKESIGQIGTTLQGGLQQGMQQIIAAHPDLAPLLEPLAPLIGSVGQSLNGVGQGLVDALRTDTRNVYAGGVSLVQPLYMGGKIRAYHQITQYGKELATTQYQTQLQNILLNTDQAYWQIVSLVQKEKVAQAYLELVQRLESDVNKMIQQGVATQIDGLSVKVKVNEAEMKLLQVEDGVILSKMVLSQLCNLPLNEPITLADEAIEDLQTVTTQSPPAEEGIELAWAHRQELRSLELATQMYEQKIRIERAEHLPTLAFTANYVVTNPSLVNGFENKFRGMWAVGALLKVPIWSWGEGHYKVKAAKAEANIARYQLSDAKEKIELQVTQATFKVNESNKRLSMAQKNREKADENLRFAHLGYQEGVIPVSNLLEAQTAWLAAQAAKIDAEIDLKLSQLYLQKSTGTLH